MTIDATTSAMTAALLVFALGLVLGFCGGALHLWVLALRAQAFGRGRSWLALALAPVGFAGPGVAALVVMRLGAGPVWPGLIGLFAGLILARRLLLSTLAHHVETGQWKR